MLNCPIYFKDEKSTRKTEVFNELTRNINPICATTNALGLGIDISTVQVVIYYGTSRILREYVQESGRAGRNQRKSEAILLNPGCSPEFKASMDPDMVSYIDTSNCRRAILDSVMDGRVGRVKCEENEEKYDNYIFFAGSEAIQAGPIGFPDLLRDYPVEETISRPPSPNRAEFERNSRKFKEIRLDFERI